MEEVINEIKADTVIIDEPKPEIEQARKEVQLGVAASYEEMDFKTVARSARRKVIKFESELLDDTELLMEFIVSLFARGWDNEKSGITYRKAMTKAIKKNNIQALECLWQGIYFHVRDNPPYDENLITAFAYANLTTIKHCIYAFQNYATLNGYYAMSRQALMITFCQNNNTPKKEEIHEYIRTLPHYIRADPYV